jgi:hypothetical protein
MNIFLTSSSFVNVVYFNDFNDFYVVFQELALECF